jgi:hypothetical protein
MADSDKTRIYHWDDKLVTLKGVVYAERQGTVVDRRSNDFAHDDSETTSQKVGRRRHPSQSAAESRRT